MFRKPYQAFLRRFAIIVEKDGVEISRDIIHAIDEFKARARFDNLAAARHFDFSDKVVLCRADKFNNPKAGRLHLPPADNWFD
jgi:hypothetical protein